MTQTSRSSSVVVYEIGFFCVLFASVTFGSLVGRGRGLIQNALTMGVRNSNNTGRSDCVYKRDADDTCPGEDILFHYYTLRNTGAGDGGGRGEGGDGYSKMQKQQIEFTSPAWLHSSGWDRSLHTVLIVHGYGGASLDYLPGAVLRDAYLNNGKYNVFMVDWGKLSAIPCYAASVHNLKPVARCMAVMLTHLRAAGLDVNQLTCVGHSLGAHLCGIMANYLPFRMHRIIGVDPAKPLIRNRASSRLDSGDADVVQIIHATSKYGDLKRMGHVDFCLNGGHVQPFCSNSSDTELCGHTRSVCYLAESLDQESARKAVPCTRRCLQGGEGGSSYSVVNSFGQTPYVVLGQHTPDEVNGVYCVTNSDAPYCSKTSVKGSPYCCPPPSKPNSDSVDQSMRLPEDED
ncbi:phospholipase A1 [Acyrthosiphon pisum]|uniref:Lipase domain-containing protein n=1 Tax=Acyrthosiphon pisum TaxID=7029 RepID=A0A8R2A2T1_ACYPI|nr:phospholipase A1 [Acyrthosiphon pisum]|eukprot:XP_001946851.1 PREDICTED: phospholipase A1 [Acyrthosiphon pisum]